MKKIFQLLLFLLFYSGAIFSYPSNTIKSTISTLQDETLYIEVIIEDTEISMRYISPFPENIDFPYLYVRVITQNNSSQLKTGLEVDFEMNPIVPYTSGGLDPIVIPPIGPGNRFINDFPAVIISEYLEQNTRYDLTTRLMDTNPSSGSNSNDQEIQRIITSFTVSNQNLSELSFNRVDVNYAADTLNLNLIITNSGKNIAPAAPCDIFSPNFNTSVYFSRDSIFDLETDEKVYGKETSLLLTGETESIPFLIQGPPRGYSFSDDYVIAVVDDLNTIHENDETNNFYPIKVLPELQISDIRVYKTPDNNVILSTTITNKGNITSELSKLDFYVEKHPRKFVARGTVPALKPNESYNVNSLVTWQYFSLVLHGRDLIIIADADNDVQEIDETNNEKRFRIPRNLNDSDQNPTLVTVSPNPFSAYVEFNYQVKYRNTDIKLSIYDQRGILRFQTNKFHSETGDFKFKIYSSQINGGANGIYHYSFLLGRNNTLYYPSTGTIIKQ
ncbi:CARDB domain-containing protein [uncultured Aquimarina sp.]|uniref:CARDB domain-containing protein n=1 Tax=uncultured Aquimarina sp. TaxID=575652 RepID=UPI00262226A6|nr:CARDB domain-containing protein [uncultured Aquimarina sp.]